MRVRCFSRNAPRMPGTEFSAKEVATSTGHGSNQRPSASRERILQLCDRSVPLLESRRTEGERRYTEEERIGRGKYRHLVNTCTSRAGPSRVREGCLSSSSSSMFFFLSLSFSFTFVHAYRYVAMYSTRFIPSFSFPSPSSPWKTHKLEVSLLYTFPSILNRWFFIDPAFGYSFQIDQETEWRLRGRHAIEAWLHSV